MTGADRTVVGAVERDLEEIAGRDPLLAGSTLAMSALMLARELDSGANSATSKSMCAKVLVETMAKLHELAPPAVRKDGIDELKEKRDGRRSRPGARRARAKTQKRS